MVQNIVLELTIYLGLLIVAISVHEFSHVAMARWLGDDTGTRMGRYTLDPLSHIDPIWTIALPAMLIVLSASAGGSAVPVFAAGKPAPYNPMRLTRRFNGKRISIRFGELLVAVAGPVSNLLLALVAFIALIGLNKSGYVYGGNYSLLGIVVRFIFLNFSLFVFNLIPIPPLDGSKVLISLLPREVARRYEHVSTQLSFLMLGLLIFGGGGMIATVVRFVVLPMVRPYLY